jgi:DNA-binding PadR family transcriptional regulator
VPGSKLNALAVAVLELLHEKAMHPYEMAQTMRDRYVSRRLKLKAGSLYHAVERLEAQGFIEIVETQREGRRPERTVYGMTATGRDAFVHRAREMIGEVAEEYPEFLSGLAVIDDVGLDAALDELEHRITLLEAAVAADQVVLAKLRADGTPEVYWLDWRYSTDRRAFELDWTKRLREDLRTGRIPFQECGATRNLTVVRKEGTDD